MENYLTQITNYLLAQSWQISVLVMVIAAVTLALKNRSAHIRYLLWLIVLAKCLVSPLVTIPLAILPQDKMPEPILISSGEMPAVNVEMADTVKYEPIALPSLAVTSPTIMERLARVTARQRLGFGWIVGVAAFLLFALVKALRTEFWLWRQRKLLPAEAQTGIENLFSGLGLKTFPKVWLLSGIGQPFVWGLLRGSIYLPANFVKVNSAEHRRGILGHELGHILRFDAAVNILQIIAQAVFWFHPFVWWANRKIRAEREKCCDEMAIARLDAKTKDYSDAIVNILISEHESTRPVPSLAVAGPVKNIEERIKTMMRPGKKFYKRPNLIAAIIVLILACLTVPTTLLITARAETEATAEREEKPAKSLPQAAADGNIDQVKSLISKGANVNAKDEKGNMALHYAAQRGRKYMIEFLLGNGARVNEKNRDGDTALHYAAKRGGLKGCKDLIVLLLANGARVNEKNIHGETPADTVVKGLFLNGQQRVIVGLLMEKGTDVSTIHLAAYVGDLARVKRFVEILVEMGTNANVADRTGFTPLHAAASSGQKDVAEFLISKGADVNAKDDVGRRPAFCAAVEGHKNMVEFLIAKGADITDGKGEYYWTTLHAAVLGCNKGIAELLLAKGADINAMGSQGLTPLHYAVAGRDLSMARLLIGHGAEVDIKDNDGSAPLDWAAWRGFKDIAELLITKGADVNAKDEKGHTSLWHAKERGHKEIVDLLRKHGARN